MDIMDLFKARHSVRRYLLTPVEEDKRKAIGEFIASSIKESGLRIETYYDEPKAFTTLLAHYGSFRNAVNYIAFIGKKKDEQKVGYYGEAIVIRLQELGLNSCWVALSYSKRKTPVKLHRDEDILCVISFGYGETSGVPHKSKKPEEVSSIIGIKPSWFDTGLEAALLAPTAVNQQKFMIICDNGLVTIAKNGLGYYVNIDLGIIRYHFEAATKQKAEIIG